MQDRTLVEEYPITNGFTNAATFHTPLLEIIPFAKVGVRRRCKTKCMEWQ